MDIMLDKLEAVINGVMAKRITKWEDIVGKQISKSEEYYYDKFLAFDDGYWMFMKICNGYEGDPESLLDWDLELVKCYDTDDLRWWSVGEDLHKLVEWGLIKQKLYDEVNEYAENQMDRISQRRRKRQYEELKEEFECG